MDNKGCFKMVKDKYDLLASVIDAIYDENLDVKVETTTLDANKAKRHAWHITDKENPQIPTRQGSYKMGAFSKNREYAESIKIGKISMRRIPLKATPTKDGKYLVDNGWKYIVRTPEGEAEFYQNDDDFLWVWSSALSKSDFEVVNGKKGRPGDMFRKIMSPLYDHVKNPKLKEAAGKGVTKDTKKSKFEKAKENLESLGIKANEEKLKKRLAVIQNKSFEM